MPTNLRGGFLGIITSFSRIGSATGPLLADYLEGYEMWVYAGLGIACCVGGLRLSETAGKPMA